VEQDSFPLENANASTIQANIGFKTGEFKGFQALAEGQFITHIGNDLRFYKFIKTLYYSCLLAHPTGFEPMTSAFGGHIASAKLLILLDVGGD